MNSFCLWYHQLLGTYQQIKVIVSPWLWQGFTYPIRYSGLWIERAPSIKYNLQLKLLNDSLRYFIREAQSPQLRTVQCILHSSIPHTRKELFSKMVDHLCSFITDETLSKVVSRPASTKLSSLSNDIETSKCRLPFPDAALHHKTCWGQYSLEDIYVCLNLEVTPKLPRLWCSAFTPTPRKKRSEFAIKFFSHFLIVYNLVNIYLWNSYENNSTNFVD